MKNQKFMKIIVVLFSAIVVMSSYGCGKKDSAPDSEKPVATDSAETATENEQTDMANGETEDSASNSNKESNSEKKKSKKNSEKNEKKKSKKNSKNIEKKKSKKNTSNKSKKNTSNKSKKEKNVSTKNIEYKGTGYKISFPETWYIADKSISERVGSDSVYYYKNQKNKEFKPNVNVMLQGLSVMGINTLKEYKELSLNQFTQNGVKAKFKNFSVNDMDVLSVEYETDAYSEGIILHYYSWAIIKDGTVFLFTYTSTLEDNPALRKSIDKIYKTIVIE